MSNAAASTAKPIAKRAKPHQQHVLYMEAIIQRTIKAMTPIKNNITPCTPTLGPTLHNVF
jgi:hypothetical protein